MNYSSKLLTGFHREKQIQFFSFSFTLKNLKHFKSAVRNHLVCEKMLLTLRVVKFFSGDLHFE